MNEANIKQHKKWQSAPTNFNTTRSLCLMREVVRGGSRQGRSRRGFAGGLRNSPGNRRR